MSFSILGTGKFVPEYVLTNNKLSTMVDTNDEWISTRTGIKERRVCKTETMTQMCVNAAKIALEEAGVEPQELDLIICATLKGDYITPAQACIVQRELGASCPAFDVNSACSGFVYGLEVAAGFFERKTVKRALVIGGDALSHLVDWTDRSTCVLFGDGVAAAVLGEGDDYIASYLTAKGDVGSLSCPRGEGTSPFYENSLEKAVIKMNGPEVYKFAVTAMVKGIKRVLKDAGLKPEDIDFVVPHQANIRIIETAMQKLKFDDDKCIKNIQNYGNTSAGSIPIALDEANKAGMLKKGGLVLLCSFGAGLTTASCIIRWSK